MKSHVSDLKKEVITHIIELEGEYANNQNDSGGATRYGVTESVARENGYTGRMQDLPYEFAFDIYSSRYWGAVCGDDLEAVSANLVLEVVDTAVNMGPARAGEFLQRSLNVFNLCGTLYADLKIDGAIGPATISAVRVYAMKRDIATLVKALNCLQGAYYIGLAERREKDEAFVYGWLRNRVAVCATRGG